MIKVVTECGNKQIILKVYLITFDQNVLLQIYMCMKRRAGHI